MTRSIDELRAAAGIALDATPWEPTTDEVRALMFDYTRAAIDAATPAAFRKPLPLDPRLNGWSELFAADPQATPSLLFVGKTGTGKTHQAYTLLRATVFVAHQQRQRPDWRAVDHGTFAERMRPHPDGEHHDWFARYSRCGLLLFDDIGAALTRDWGIDRFQALVDHRWRNQLPTIWTTNAASDDALKPLFGDRVVSRIWSGRRISFTGTDHRKAAR